MSTVRTFIFWCLVLLACVATAAETWLLYRVLEKSGDFSLLSFVHRSAPEEHDALSTWEDVTVWAAKHGKDAAWAENNVIALGSGEFWLVTQDLKGTDIDPLNLPQGLEAVPPEGLTLSAVPEGLPEALPINLRLQGVTSQDLGHLPQKILGSLEIQSPTLTTLENIPQEVRILDVRKTAAVSLPAGRTVGRVLVEDTQKELLLDAIAKGYKVDVDLTGDIASLTELGLPQEIKGSLGFTGLPLLSAAGSPQIVHGDFRIILQEPKTLEGLPPIVNGSLDLRGSVLVSLLGIPSAIGKDLYLSGTGIEGLQRLPKKIGGSLFVQNLEVESIPKGLEIGGKVVVSSLDSKLGRDAVAKGYGVVDRLE